MCFMELTLKETWSITCSTVLRVPFRVTPWNARLTARIHDHDRLPPGALRCVSEAAFCTASLKITSDLKMHTETTERISKYKRPLLPKCSWCDVKTSEERKNTWWSASCCAQTELFVMSLEQKWLLLKDVIKVLIKFWSQMSDLWV